MIFLKYVIQKKNNDIYNANIIDENKFDWRGACVFSL